MPEIVEKLTRIGNEAVRRAQEKNRRNGVANVYSINGKIVWQLPDGTVTSTNPQSSPIHTAPASFSATRSIKTG